ncbi:MAG: lysylphosphatidylglycerol synthase transmembrane domain-containing protein [Actinomycetota bacterium]|nr:lysylphosphatidylglycerol synthase transmembrane domain-containing protein [Actinomycetota bacterium]
MISPDPAASLVHVHRPSGRARALLVLRVVVGVAVLAGAGYALFSNWSEVKDTVFNIGWQIWVPAFLVLPLAILCSTLSWQVLVDELGEPIGPRQGSQIFLVGQLGKYLPGSVWAYVLQVELGRRAGVARARIFTATVFSVAILVVAALLAGSLAIPSIVDQNPDFATIRWLYLLLPIGIVGLHPRVLTGITNVGFKLMKRPLPGHPIRKRAVLVSLAWALSAYALFGLHLWILVEGAEDADLDALRLTVGTMAIAMVSGLFFFVLPSGAGIREAVIVSALAALVPTGQAIALAAVSRVFLTLADLATAGVATAMATAGKRRYETEVVPLAGD